MKNYLDEKILQKLYKVILKWDTYTKQNKKIIDIFSFKIDTFFIKKIELYNSWFFEKQLDIYKYIININNNLSNNLIKDIIKQIINDNIDSCISFCRLNNIFIDFSSYFIVKNITEIVNTHFLLKI